MKPIIVIFAIVLAAAFGNQANADPASGNGEEVTSVPEGAGAPAAFDKMPAPGTKARCLVTGHDFTVRNTTEFTKYKGKYYVFCCGGCKPQFDANPEKFINSAK